jgi:Na+/melibiose symporter-like transporter
VVLAIGTAAAVPAGGRAALSPGATVASGRRGFGFVHLLAVAAVLASAAGVGLVAFLVVYAIDSGLSESQAGLLLAGVSLSASISRLAVGGMADRGGHDALGAVVAMLALSAGGYLLLIVREPAAVLAGALFVGRVGWAWPGALTLAVVRRTPEAPAWAVGVMMSGLFPGRACRAAARRRARGARGLYDRLGSARGHRPARRRDRRGVAQL